MFKQILPVTISAVLWSALLSPASAQGAFDLSGFRTASAGSQSNTTYRTGETSKGSLYPQSSSLTNRQRPGTLTIVSTAGLAPVFGLSESATGGDGAASPTTASTSSSLAGALSGAAGSAVGSTLAGLGDQNQTQTGAPATNMQSMSGGAEKSLANSSDGSGF